MRTLSSTLTQAQKDMGKVLCKIVLTSGANSYTYGVDTTNRLLNLRHPEDEWNYNASIVVDNRDGNLTALALQGYEGIISYGYNTSAGDEYSASAPLECIAQKTDSVQGNLITIFTLAGIFNMMSMEQASEPYNLDEDNNDTIKTILTGIANGTLRCFNAHKNYTITFDSEDSLIDTFKPKENYTIAFGESRLSAFRRALRWTKCKAIIKADGQIHVFNPTVSGTTYDYQYNDAIAAANHNFFAKSTRTRLVIPNKIVVSSDIEDDPQYSGNATDSASYTSLGRYITQYERVRLASNAEGTSIAEALIQNAQLAAEMGHGHAPMNVGQELFDYIKITDSRADDTRVGNVGYIIRNYRPGKFDFEFRFGSLRDIGLAGTMPPNMLEEEIDETSEYDWAGLIAGLARDIGDNRGAISSLAASINEIIDAFKELAKRETVPQWHVTHRLIIPVLKKDGTWQ